MIVESFLTALRDTDVMLPLLGSLLAGALIGSEREFQGKPAGLRTHTLVCFASALMTLLGLRMAEWVAVLPEGTQVVSDMSRMPHAILTGVGFLGAGVIFREGTSVQGLTTAASLWLTAALGIVFGTGLMGLAAIGTLVAVIVLALLRYAQRFAPPGPQLRIALDLPPQSTFKSADLVRLLAPHHLAPGPIALEVDSKDGQRRYRLLAKGRSPRVDLEALEADLSRAAAPLRIEISPVEYDAAAAH